jgi:hypothetical protein
MFHGVAGIARRIHAAARRCHDDGFAAGQADWTLAGVGKRAAGLRDAVYRGLELRRYVSQVKDAAQTPSPISSTSQSLYAEMKIN